MLVTIQRTVEHLDSSKPYIWELDVTIKGETTTYYSMPYECTSASDVHSLLQKLQSIGAIRLITHPDKLH